MSLNPTTLQSLITLLRQTTNMENSQFVTDSELTSYINDALALLDAVLISKFDDYKLTEILTTIVPNTNYVSLPLDFLKFRGLDIQYNTTNPDGYTTVHEHSFQKRNDYSYPGTWLTIGPMSITYRLQGQQVVLLPAILAGQYQYRLWYTPDYIPLVNPSDTLQTYMDSQNWYQYAIAEAATFVLAKQDLDATIFMEKSAMLKDHITKLSAPNRNSGAPKSVVDTRGPWGGGGGNQGGGYGWSW